MTGLESDDPVIQTWAKAYGEIADVFIKLEQKFTTICYGKVLNHLKSQTLHKKTSDIKSFTVESEEYDLSQFEPGQYITVDVSSEKLPYRAKRHYSIIDGDEKSLSIWCQT